MPGWLYGLPKTCIVLLFGVIGAVLFVGALFLRAKLWRFEGQTDYSKTARDALTVVIGFAGLMLAFLLVQEQIKSGTSKPRWGQRPRTFSPRVEHY